MKERQRRMYEKMRVGLIAGLFLLVILLTFALANIQALFWMSSPFLVSTVLPSLITDMTNNERIIASKPPLRYSEILEEAATLKAKDMADKAYFSHYSPDGVSPWYWFDRVNYPFVHAGENLAVHFSDSQAVVDAWMASPGHRANILNDTYEEIGIGIAEGVYKGFPTVFVVELFGTPIPFSFQQSTRSDEENRKETTIFNHQGASGYEALSFTREKVLSRITSDSTTTNDKREEYYDENEVKKNDGQVLGLDSSSRVTQGKKNNLFFFYSLTQTTQWLLGIYACVTFASGILLYRASKQGSVSVRSHAILYTLGLLFLMGVLWYLHTRLVGGAVVI